MRTGNTKDLREILLAKRRDLTSGSGGRLDTLLRPDNAAMEDLAPVFHDQFVALRLNRIDAQLLRDLDESLNRLSGGEYGVCTDCGEAINPKRLQAIPWAPRCILCQEAWTDADSGEPADAEWAA